MMTVLLMTICQNEFTPSMTRPSPRMPMTNAPMIVPQIVPRPPANDVPPSTVAAIALSSKVSPLAGCDDQPCERRTPAGDHIDNQLHPIDPHAREQCRTLVADSNSHFDFSWSGGVLSGRRGRATYVRVGWVAALQRRG